MDQVYKISISEDNRSLLYHLVIAIPKKKNIVID